VFQSEETSEEHYIVVIQKKKERGEKKDQLTLEFLTPRRGEILSQA